MAVLDSVAGQLHIYDTKAFDSLIDSLFIRPTSSHAKPRELFDSFTKEQWVAYGRNKASIASRVCKENGKLKAMLHKTVGTDPLVENDPWGGCTLPSNECADHSLNHSLWSSWSLSLNGHGTEDADPDNVTANIMSSKIRSKTHTNSFDALTEDFLVGPGRPPRTTTPPGTVGRGAVGDAGSGDTSSAGRDGDDNGDDEPLDTNISKEDIEGKTVYLEAGTVPAYMSRSGIRHCDPTRNHEAARLIGIEKEGPFSNMYSIKFAGECTNYYIPFNTPFCEEQ